jgi:aromatic ring hydroxylase-like protein
MTFGRTLAGFACAAIYLWTFVELTPREDLQNIAAGWSKRIDLIASQSDWPADELLIRPDGYLA